MFSANSNPGSWLTLVILAAALILPHPARAVPSFARQTGLSCITCHTEFPILTEFGRNFKLTGYTLSSGESQLPPIAIMLQPSFTETNRDQPGGAAPHFGRNSNFALTQGSIFYNGRLFGPYADALFGPALGSFLNKIGIFDQTTFDGVARRWHWDNTEIRYADQTMLAGMPATYGFYLNNNPTMQDPWNSTPAWGFPFSNSSLGPTPGANTLINGGLSQEVMGFGAYTLLANSFYFDFAAYHTLSASLQRFAGIDPSGEPQIPDLAPYWRFAYTKASGNRNLEVGLFGLAANSYPGRVNSAGRDRILDLGFDSEYQISFGRNDVTGLFSTIYEHDEWSASRRLGLASHSSDHLWSTKATIDYLFDKTYGGAASYFIDSGSNDAVFYSDSKRGSPLSDGIVLQLNYLPLNKGGGPSFWPKSNVKFSVQYVIYDRFNGGRSNYDGKGRNASDNNTLYFESWIAF